jgi:hypothetical protein
MSTIVTRSGKGSALTFNEVDTNFTNLNTDKYQSGNNVAFGTISASGISTFSAGSAGAPALTTTGDTNTGIFFPAADTIAFSEGGVESMRIDSAGNVGIGTTSPYAKTDIFQATAGYGGWKYGLNLSGTDYPALRLLATTGNTGNIIGHDAGSLVFLNGTTNILAGSERMRIDAAGNLGLGVTPSAGGGAIEISNAANSGIFTRGTTSNFSQGVYLNSGWKNYNTTGQSALYLQLSGAHQWYYSASSTGVGTTATFTQAMTLNSSGNLSVGTTSVLFGVTNTKEISINGTNGSTLSFGNGGALASYIYNASGNMNINTYTGGFISIQTNSVERMRFDASGNVGIGTSSPSQKLSISNGGAAGVEINPTLRNGVANTGGSILVYNRSGTAFLPLEIDALDIRFDTSGTERMRIDSAGNVGIGATSVQGATNIERSSSAGTVAATSSIVLSNRNSTSGTFVAGGIFSNTYRDISTSQYTAGVWFLKQNSTVSGTSASQGAVVFGANDVTSSGDLPTERMRIDSSGNLGLGVTPSAWSGVKAMQVNTASIWGAGTSNAEFGANEFYNGTTRTYITSNPASMYNQSGGVHSWSTAPSGTAGAAITFTQAMTLTSSGNLLVGTTTVSVAAGERVSITALTGNNGLGIAVGNHNNPAIALYNGYTATGTATAIQFQDHNSQIRGSITVTTSATAYNTSSDYRLKENIAPMTGALATIAQLKPVTYNWKADGSDGQGFIAHELAEVVPDCVSGEKDATEEQEYEISPAIPAVLDEEGNEVTPAVEAVMGTRTVPVYQGIDTSFLVATLTAAIQEQQALIASLTTRLDALEGK